MSALLLTGDQSNLFDVQTNGSIEILETSLFAGIQNIDTTNPSLIEGIQGRPDLAVQGILDLDLGEVTVSSGTVTRNTDGTITYTAEPGFTGDVQIEYTVTDQYGNSIVMNNSFAVSDTALRVEVLQYGNLSSNPDATYQNVVEATIESQIFTSSYANAESLFNYGQWGLSLFENGDWSPIEVTRSNSTQTTNNPLGDGSPTFANDADYAGFVQLSVLAQNNVTGEQVIFEYSSTNYARPNFVPAEPPATSSIKSDILDPFNITGGELGAYSLYTFGEGDVVTDSLLSKPETSFLTNYEDSTGEYSFQGSDLLNLYQSTNGSELSVENVSFNTFDLVSGSFVELTSAYDAASDTYTVETGGSNFVNINFDVTDGSGVSYPRQELTAADESLVLEGVEGVSYFYAQDQVNDNNAWDKKGYTEDGDYWVKVKNSSDSLIGDGQEIALVMGSDDILTGTNVAQADIVNGLANGDLISTKSWYSYDGTFNFAKFDAADVDSLVQSGDTLRIARIDANTGEQIGGAQAFRADLTFDKFATAFDRSLSNQNDFQYGEILESQTGGF